MAPRVKKPQIITPDGLLAPCVVAPVQRCPRGLRIVPSGKWWSEKLGLTQDMFESSELVSLKNGFADPNKPDTAYYQKYACKLKDGREIVIQNRVTDVLNVMGKGDALIDWAVNEALTDCLGEPVLHGVDRKTGEVLEVKGSWRKIDAAKKRCQSYRVEMIQGRWRSLNDTDDGTGSPVRIYDPTARIQAWEQYSPMQLEQAHRQSFDARFRNRDKAAELGTRAHNLISWWLEFHDLQDRAEAIGLETVLFDRVHLIEDGQRVAITLTNEPREVQNACRAFHEFWTGQGLRLVATEQFLADLAAGVAGTVDCVARGKDGRLIGLDWKTSSGVYSSMMLQKAAYCRLWWLCRDEHFDRAYVVRLDKMTAAVQVVPVFVNETQRDDLLAAWDTAVKLYHWNKGAGKYLAGFKATEEDE